jgi:excisionase family DNA binding protein
MASELIGLEEAARLLGVSVFTIRRLADAGEIRVVNVAARRLISFAEIERIKLHGAGSARRRSTRRHNQSGKK